jgi:hypothetical protein
MKRTFDVEADAVTADAINIGRYRDPRGCDAGEMTRA